MGKKIASAFKYVFLGTLSFISIFPFYWMLMASTNKSIDVTRGTLIPGTYFFENLKSVMASDLLYMNSYGNSVIIAVTTTILAMIVSSAAGYAFVVYRSKARDRIFDFIFASMMVPFAALMVPLFKLFSNFNKLGLTAIGLNSPGAVIITGIAISSLVYAFGPQLLSLYVSSSDADHDAVLAAGMVRLTYVGLPYFLCGLMEVATGALRGIGKSWTPLIISTLGACVFRIFWTTVIFPMYPALEVLYLSYPISWTITPTAHFIALYISRKKLKRSLSGV